MTSGTSLVSVNEVERLRETVLNKLQENPDRAFRVLEDWLRRGAKKK